MKFTYGNTPAAVRLELLVENNPIARRKISNLLGGYTNQLLHITGAKDRRTVQNCLKLLRDDVLRRIDSNSQSDWSSDIKSYIRNIVIMRYRVYSREFDNVHKVLARLEKSIKAA